jgi:sugar phosphate permease
VVFIALLKLNAAWFHDRQFATLSGLTLLLGNVGAVLSAAPLAWLVRLISWRTVFVAAGALSALLGVMAWWRVRDSPKQAGFPSMREMDGKEAHAPHEGHWREGLKSVLGNRLTWPGFWVGLGAAGSFFTFGGLWAVPYLRDVHGMTTETAALHTTAFLTAFAFGSLAIGSLSDRLGRRRPVMIGALALFALC